MEGSDRGIAMVAMDFGQARRNPSYTSLLFGKEPIWQISDIKDVCSHAFIARVRRKSWPGGVAEPLSVQRDVNTSIPTTDVPSPSIVGPLTDHTFLTITANTSETLLPMGVAS